MDSDSWSSFKYLNIMYFSIQDFFKEVCYE